MSFWLTLLGAVATTTAILSLGGTRSLNAPLLRIGIENTYRSVGIVLLVALLLAILGRRVVWANALAGIFGLIGFATLLVAIAAQGKQMTAVSDGALIELYTILALKGQQWLGAYSQFGWHHPGPLMFYLLAPFYALGGRSVLALNAGVVTINVIGFFLAVGVLASSRQTRIMAATVALLLDVYLLRVPSLLASGWNPHILVLPLVTCVTLTACAAMGMSRVLPVLAVLASLVLQAHVSTIPAAVVALGVGCGLWLMWGHPRFQLARDLFWANVALWLLAVTWAMPVAEQLTETPGNMTRLVEFFSQPTASSKALGVAWAAFADILTGAFRPTFQLAKGWVMEPRVTLWPTVGTTILIVGLAAVAVRWRKVDRRAEATMAIVCLAVTLTGFVSIMKIGTQIGDYQVFWLSALGVLDAAVILGAILSAVMDTKRFSGVIAGGIAITLCVPPLLGLREIMGGWHAVVDDERIAVDRLTTMLDNALVDAQVRRPEFQVDLNVFGVAAGVILEFEKRHRSFAIDPALVNLFGRSYLPTGDEDAIVAIAGPARHGELQQRGDNIVGGEYFRKIYLDIVLTPSNR